MRLLRQISLLPDAIHRLTRAIQSHDERIEASGPSEARLEELERSRTLWEAKIEGLILRAENTLKSANNAESRARTMLRHYEKDADPFDEDGEEEPGAVPEGYAPVLAEEELQPVHVDLATAYKAHALAAKFA